MREQIIGMDIGGSHVAGAWVQPNLGITGLINKPLNTKGSAGSVIEPISEVILELSAGVKGPIKAGIAMPGPFNYAKGVCEIHGVGGKFAECFGLHFKEAILSATKLHNRADLYFFNDAHCFAMGSYKHQALADMNVICITLGTGFGSTFILGGQIAEKHSNIPVSGMFYCEPFKDGIADDYFSTRWFLREYQRITGNEQRSVKELFELAESDPRIRSIFSDFGVNLATFLAPWIRRSESTALIIGGNISKSHRYFINALKQTLARLSAELTIHISEDTEQQIMEGAALLAADCSNNDRSAPFRKTSQPLLPLVKKKEETGYEIFPSFHVKDGKIETGYDPLARAISTEKTLVIDGYGGVLWEHFREQLADALNTIGIQALWYDINSCLKPEPEINAMIAESLNGDDPVFGNKFQGTLIDFFDRDKLNLLRPDNKNYMCIVYGTGASLSGWEGKMIYLDTPKNEIQYRMRAGSISNIGSSTLFPATQMYKRFYFVDWPVLNEHKKDLLPRIDIVADEQRATEISWMEGDFLRGSLNEILQHAFRARPWFEAGVWGGQWMKSRLKGLNKEEVNYAWSFELITPENGIVLEQNGKLLEISFDFLLYHNNRKLLGKAADRFRYEFPIRFDFLDTFDGGNLSIQCHPRTDYIKKHFGENFTQDETYYILDCKEDAEVYLGFQKNIDPASFRNALEDAQRSGHHLNIREHVLAFPANKHDLFLIPNGTIHASGRNNLVLEISSTPYIFTFKMYDWQRLDLTGKPRPINIEHAFNNLYFDRKGEWVEKNLVSRPKLVEKDQEHERYLLPTHPEHFYCIERYEITGEITVKTNGQCHIGMLVEGDTLEICTGSLMQKFHYAETFVIPAAVGEYRVKNTQVVPLKMVISYVKDE